MSAHTIDVSIAGQSYKLAVAPENETALREAVALVDGHMTRLKANANNKSTERMAVMTAISLASDVLQKKTSAENTTADPQIASKITSIQSRLDEALAQWGVAV